MEWMRAVDDDRVTWTQTRSQSHTSGESELDDGADAAVPFQDVQSEDGVGELLLGEQGQVDGAIQLPCFACSHLHFGLVRQLPNHLSLTDVCLRVSCGGWMAHVFIQQSEKLSMREGFCRFHVLYVRGNLIYEGLVFLLTRPHASFGRP